MVWQSRVDKIHSAEELHYAKPRINSQSGEFLPFAMAVFLRR
jgi:hypothetical protein